MDDTQIILNAALGLLLGAAVGLKNEIEKNDSDENILGGFRTHALLALMGLISGIMFINGVVIFSTLLSGALTIFILIYYFHGIFKYNNVGITDEISAIFAHFIGILVITQSIPIKLLIATTILAVFILTRKKSIRKIGQRISNRELLEFTLYAVITLVILPYLPNESFSLNEIGVGRIEEMLGLKINASLLDIEFINPFQTWLIVVLVSGIDILGYLLSKVVSRDSSTLISASIGGFVSSTSTTVALAIKSRAETFKDEIDGLVGSALSANASSFIQATILIAPISTLFLKQIFVPITISIVGGYLFAATLLRKNKQKHIHHKDTKTLDKDKIFKFESAVKFAFLLTGIKFISKFALELFGKEIFLATSAVAATTGIDAVVISTAELTQASDLTPMVAFLTFMTINGVNLLSKFFYSYTSGSKKFAFKFGVYTLIIFTFAFTGGLLYQLL